MLSWRIKAGVQWLFARLPFGERLNHLAQIAKGSFSDAAMRSELTIQGRYLRSLDARFPLAGKRVLEIGPGWAGFGTVLLASFGIERIYAVDHQPHLRLPLLRRAASIAHGIGFDVPQNVSLESLRVTYIAPGDAARTGLPDHSIDMVYSYGVLEHIPPASLESICRETVRILKPGGRASHNIGLHDHFHSAGLGNGVNFLRYSQRWWDFIASGPAYHNRLRLPQYLAMFQRHGLTPVWQERELLELNLEALRRIRVHERFSGFPAEDLAASHLFVDLISEPAGSEDPQ